MPSPVETRIPTDDDLAQYGEITSNAFHYPIERARPYFDSVGIDNLRVARLDGRVAGGIAMIPMGQFFGGRSVPMVGVAAVAIAPEYRSRKVAGTLMREAICDMHARGVPISTLYPATQPVYRRVGYEIAGVQYEAQLAPQAIDVRDNDLLVRRLTDADAPAVRALYAELARDQNGQLDRNDFIWRRVANLRGDATTPFVVENNGRIEGYIYYFLKAEPYSHQRMRMTDIVASTRAAARRLLRFIADHRSMVDRSNWYTGPCDPFAALLAEQKIEFRSGTSWMVRITHVERALAQRGYAPGLTAELHLNVRDDIIAGNVGRYLLRVRDGVASVDRVSGAADASRATPGGLDIDVRGLAALYTGYADPQALRLCGYLEASPREMATARAIFAGPTPWMRDPF
ncbi:MAG: GNAT family N-acetyltransferase [Phycisphaerae bacterium]